MFRQDFSCPALLVASLVPHQRFRVRGYHPLSLHFPEHSTTTDDKFSRLFPFRSPLLWESRLISFPVATQMFQFATFALHAYVFSMQYPCGWVSPFGNLRIKARLPAPRSLSQATTSFIACNRQGIHHVHLFACPYNVDLFLEKPLQKYLSLRVCRIQSKIVLLEITLHTF